MKILFNLQEKHPLIGDVRGVGMMQSRGVIVNQGGTSDNVLKMSPPFVITPAHIKAAFQIMDDCLTKAEKKQTGKARGTQSQ